MKGDANPMHLAPRCTAKSKRTGLPCKSPAVRGWKICRMHGARGGHKSGHRHPQYQHGGRSLDMEATRKLITALAREARDHLGDMDH
jgi:hypothetical protein